MAPRKTPGATRGLSPAAPPSSSSSSAPPKPASSKPSSNNPATILGTALSGHQNATPQRIKLIDAFMGFLVVVGVLQFAYCVVAGNYPFNAFLAGFSATVGQFVLAASLRIQSNPENKEEFKAVSPERAFADFVFGSLVLHFFCVNFIN